MRYLIKNATIVNEGEQYIGYVLIENEWIAQTGTGAPPENADEVIDAEGKLLLPGIIDDQVHFREPGLTHKATIYSETRAAAAGGVTSIMEMPNTKPQTVTQDLLEAKYGIGEANSVVNYSFYMGATNDNYKEVRQTDPAKICGIKVFMGASTGNMLVDDEQALQRLFSGSHMLMTTHCEDEPTIRRNMERIETICGSRPDASCHPLIRTSEACYRSSSRAVNLAHKYDTQLHILHLSAAREMGLLEAQTPLKDKRITAEACIHHLWFTDADYQAKGNFIKWNPAVKTEADRNALRKAVKRHKIDVIATDHAPHTLEEKQQPFPHAPSGGPMVQHSLLAMLELAHQGIFQLETVVEKTAHAPAELFRIDRRGYIREGYYADLVLVDTNTNWQVQKDNVLYKAGWSPMEGVHFRNKVTHTFVNGNLVYKEGLLDEDYRGKRLLFNR